MLYRRVALFVVAAILVSTISRAVDQANPVSMKKWKQGVGWGWVWGEKDEVGALNEMTDASRLAALRSVRSGKVFDLGVKYDRESFKWPGHNPGEIISFRTPEGVKRQGDFAPATDSSKGTAWHSCAVFISDNVATQIDGLAHATEGKDNHWYNGFKEKDWGGNWGPRKCDASNIPPIIARGVLIDVAGYKGVRALPPHYGITVDDLRGALEKQNTELRPGDVVLIRTGAIQFWHDMDERQRLSDHDSAGLLLESAQWLVEQKGAMMVGSDTSGLERWPAEEDAEAQLEEHGSFMPVHNYLLIEQGVHIAEFHYLEDLAKESAFEFCYVCTTAKIRGTTAGFALRPIAIR